MYNIAFSDVKEQPVKLFDNSSINKMDLNGTDWKYNYEMNNNAVQNNAS